MEVCGQENGGNKASNGAVCRCQQVLMSEMLKRQQVHEDARKMYWAKVLVKEFGK